MIGKQAIAASPAPGVVIENQATGSYVDTSDNQSKTVSSDIVKLTVAEVAGITVTATGNSGSFFPGQTVYFIYTIKNVGNDPTQFFIPSAANITGSATQASNIEITGYSLDGVALTTPPTAIVIPNGGGQTGRNASGTAGLLQSPNGEFQPDGYLTVRVPVLINSNATTDDPITVRLGDTPEDSASTSTPKARLQNQAFISGSNDLYTVDNADTLSVTNEASGLPINGDTTSHLQEASAVQLVTIQSPIGVSGTVFDDADLNQSKGVTEVGISNVTIVLRNTLTNTCQSVKTNGQGIYTFATVLPGTYELIESASEMTPTPGNCPSIGRDPSGYASTTPNLRQITVGTTSLINQDFGDHLAPNFGLCPSPAYISQGNTASDIALKGVNLLNGAVTTIGSGTLIPSANAIGFSQIDNFIYGSRAGSGRIYRVDGNGVGYDLGVVAGLTISPNYNVGDVDARGWLHLYQTNGTTIDVVDVNPNSTNFLKLIYKITLPPLQIQDFAFHPTDGSLYTVRQNGVFSRVKITYPVTVPTTLPGAIGGSNVVVENFTNLSPTLPSGQAYGSVYFAQGGEFYFYRNSNGTSTTTGSIYTVTLPSNTPTSTRLSVSTLTLNAPQVINNDGARCSNAPAPTASNPNILLVKRITAINGSTTTQGGGDNLSGYVQDNSNPYDDNLIEPTLAPNLPSFPVSDTQKWPNTTDKASSTFLIGGINGGKTKPNGEVEYTIYFLSSGTSTAKNVILCDRVPRYQTFVPDAFNSLPVAPNTTPASPGGDRGIAVFQGSTTNADTVYGYTNIGDGDAARYYPPGSTLPSACTQPALAEDNGTIVVNLGDVPNATIPGTPKGSYGFLRFRARVK